MAKTWVYRRPWTDYRRPQRPGPVPLSKAAAVTGRIMSSMAFHGGLAGHGGIAGKGGGLAG